MGGAAVPVALHLRDPWSAMAAVSVCAVRVIVAALVALAVGTRIRREAAERDSAG